MIPETKETIRLPRLLILFEAEDPDVFINRLADAYDRRAKVELLLQQQFYIDSMPRGQTIQLDENIENVVRAQVSLVTVINVKSCNNLKYDFVYGVKKPVTADPDSSSDILEDEAPVSFRWAFWIQKAINQAFFGTSEITCLDAVSSLLS